MAKTTTKVTPSEQAQENAAFDSLREQAQEQDVTEQAVPVAKAEEKKVRAPRVLIPSTRDNMKDNAGNCFRCNIVADTVLKSCEYTATMANGDIIMARSKGAIKRLATFHAKGELHCITNEIAEGYDAISFTPAATKVA